MSENKPNIIFLFGAGASIPAGLSGIAKLTETFEKEKLDEKLKDAYYFIKDVLTQQTGVPVDIENILQQLNEFVYGSRETSRLFYKEQDNRVIKFQEDFPKLIELIKNHLREKLEGRYKTDYLLGLKGLVESYGNVEIFSLNYDSVIETFCEKNGISYTDGFKLYWNPEEFKQEVKIKIFKLHGSLYWFKTEKGKLIKIPAKNLNANNMKFYSDEEISESMVYPSIIKELELNPYSFLRNQFIESLSKCDLLVVVGYSFRDAGWLNIVKDQLNTNRKLWVLIVDLYPAQIRKKIVERNDENNDRIITLTQNSEDAFGLRILNDRINQINQVKEMEEDYLQEISNNSKLVFNQFLGLIQEYIRINQLGRIKKISEQTFRTRFTHKLAVLPQLTNELFIYSLQFGIECCIKRDWVLAETWFQILAFKTLETENQIANKHNQFISGTQEKWVKAFEDEMGIKHFAMGNSAKKEELEKLLDFEFANRVTKLDGQTRNIIEELIIRIQGMNINGDIKTLRYDAKKFLNEMQNISIIFPLAKLLKSFSAKIPQNEKLTTNWNYRLLHTDDGKIK